MFNGTRVHREIFQSLSFSLRNCLKSLAVISLLISYPIILSLFFFFKKKKTVRENWLISHDGRAITEKSRAKKLDTETRIWGSCFSFHEVNNDRAYNWPRLNSTCSQELVTALRSFRIVRVSNCYYETEAETSCFCSVEIISQGSVASVIFQFR